MIFVDILGLLVLAAVIVVGVIQINKWFGKKAKENEEASDGNKKA